MIYLNYARNFFSFKHPVMKCKSPPSIHNGSVSVNSLLYGGRAEYKCKYGFKRSLGNAVITCNGTDWSGVALKCSGCG